MTLLLGERVRARCRSGSSTPLYLLERACSARAAIRSTRPAPRPSHSVLLRPRSSPLADPPAMPRSSTRTASHAGSWYTSNSASSLPSPPRGCSPLTAHSHARRPQARRPALDLARGHRAPGRGGPAHRGARQGLQGYHRTVRPLPLSLDPGKRADLALPREQARRLLVLGPCRRLRLPLHRRRAHVRRLFRPRARSCLRGKQTRLTRCRLSRRRSKRVFILGPSHHVYLDGCALSKCKEYETPIGNLPLDLDSASPPSPAVPPSHTRADSGDDARSHCRAQGDGQV